MKDRERDMAEFKTNDGSFIQTWLSTLSRISPVCYCSTVEPTLGLAAIIFQRLGIRADGAGPGGLSYPS